MIHLNCTDHEGRKVGEDEEWMDGGRKGSIIITRRGEKVL